MNSEYKLLDHGYLKVINSWGSDAQIIESARMSTSKGFLGWGPKPCPGCSGRSLVNGQLFQGDGCAKCKNGLVEGDEKLLKYLYDNKHSTPFEFAGLTIEVQAPIFVFREWHRHRTQGYNEMSARYTPLPDLNYMPSIDRLLVGSDGKNKQAGTVANAEPLTRTDAESYQLLLKANYEASERFYQQALKSGVPKELARIHLPVGRYSRMRATANLRNWLGFLTLRMAPQAQYEIRVYAEAIGDVILSLFPRTYNLFSDGNH